MVEEKRPYCWERQAFKSDIRNDEHGVLRGGAPRVMLESVVAAFKQGDSADTIRQQDPALVPEETRGRRPCQRGKTKVLAGEPVLADRLAEMRDRFQQLKEAAK